MTTIVYGASLAALVAAEELSATGAPVTLITPSPHLGGHFAGVTVGDKRFDAGLVIFEFGALNTEATPDPLSYDPDVRNDCGRFGTVLARHVERLGIRLQRTPPFRLWTDGALVPDFVFDTRLEGVRALPARIREHAHAEVDAIVAGGNFPIHARRKYIEPRYEQLSYEAASLANHGTVLHTNFFEPMARKVTARGTADVLALYSRAVWHPLVWPETLQRAFGGETQLLADMPFHVAAGGAVGDLVDALARRLRSRPWVSHRVATATALRREPHGIDLELSEGRERGAHLVWGHDLDALARLTGVADAGGVERSAVAIVLATVPREHVADSTIGTVIIPQDPTLPYRITNQSANAGVPDEPMVRISAEWGGADALANDAELLACTRAALARIGMTSATPPFGQQRVLRIGRALVLPSAANRARILAMRQGVAALGLPLHLVSPAGGFGVASLSDQLLQGIKAGRLINDAVVSALGAVEYDALERAATSVVPRVAAA